MEQLLTYDLECWPNIFTFTGLDRQTGQIYYFEVSWRVNHLAALLAALEYWHNQGFIFVGFNNKGYDEPLLQGIIESVPACINAHDIYLINDRIISTPWDQRFSNMIPSWRSYIKQIDLFKIHHFDNASKSTSLKVLEFVMRSKSIQDLPYPPGIPVPENDEVANNIREYNEHDVVKTEDFLKASMKAINFRFTMSEKYDRDFTNHNDTKIGKDYFIQQLELAGVPCFENKRPRQTHRDHIDLSKLVFPYVSFTRPEFKAVLNQINNSIVTETKGSLSLSAVIDGFSFDFGLGGIHGSVEGQTFYSDDEMVITDADVASYYPNLAIKNKLFPEHLSEKFCDVYEDVYQQRKSYAKGTVENAAMKLALNGVYGDSNSVYSPFYDPCYTMAITVNGQLLLCMLAEKLIEIPGMVMIQINTDGLTIKYPRIHKPMYDAICDWWQKLTLLELEFVDYKSMHIRDVNNYIAVPYDKPPKFKGAYVHTGAHEKNGELGWHQKHSALVIKKAATAAILNNIPVREFITNHPDIFDFFLLAKVGKKDQLQLRHDIEWNGITVFENQVFEELQSTSRYLITNTGHKLVKLMPAIKRRTPKVSMYLPGWVSKKITGRNKNLEVSTPYEYENAIKAGYKTKDGGVYDMGPIRQFGIDKDYLVTIYNTVSDFDMYDINYNYYITEAEKLVNGVIGIK
jgi:hypothetical protein